MKEVKPGHMNVPQAVERVLRDSDACFTRGEIVEEINRRSLHPRPGTRCHEGRGTWETLEHTERLREVQAALESHPELFRNHGPSAGWAVREHISPRRHGDTEDGSVTTAGTAQSKRKGGSMAGDSRAGDSRAGDRKTCVHCRTRPVAQGESGTSIAAEKMSLCSTCYHEPEIKKARRKAMGLPPRGPITPRASSSAKSGASGAKNKTKLLPAPARPLGPRKASRGARGRVQAGLVRAGGDGTSPVPVPQTDLRSAIGTVLKDAFAWYAAHELRSLADDLEKEADARA